MSYESLCHSKWDCKYHLVFVPKGRKKNLYGKIRKFLGPVFHELARQRSSTIIEGHMVQDHVHMVIKIRPKYAVAEVVGYTGTFEHDLTKPAGMKQKLVDVTQQTNLGWTPKTDLTQGIRRTYQFYLNEVL